MKIKLDENMPFRLTEWLRTLGHDADSVQEEGLAGASDAMIWERIQGEGRFLITMDLDFSDTRVFRPGQHAGILLIRLSPGSRLSVNNRVRQIFEQMEVESWCGCFVVASETRIRVLSSPIRSGM
ncbi:MAG: DUF5615 family PIN-like protein [Magnetococcales bacterium]|nr:DUF5615 family PIN-like protein [Magnetococcales bacterium]MBF0420175.1 DUF5615 family PIN-like protein [Magnetococcales bacterium]